MIINKLLVFVVFLLSCASPSQKKSAPPREDVSLSSKVGQSESTSVENPQYVVLFKTTRLYFQQDEGGDFVQFIGADEQAEFDRLRKAQAADLIRKEKVLLDKKKAKAATRKKANRKKMKAAKKKHKKRWRRMSKKQRKNALLKEKRKKERQKAKAIRAQRKKAERKISATSKQMKADSPDGDRVSFFPMRMLKRKGNWVQVETISQSVEMSHCHQDVLKSLGDMKIRFWVKSSDISDVVSRSVSVNVKKGAPLKLLPGLGILNEGGQQYIFVAGFKLPVTLHSDSIAHNYRPLRGMDQPITDTVFSALGIARGLRFGKERLPINPFFSKYVSQTLKIGSKNYAAFQSRCAEVFVRVEKGDIERAGPRGVTRFGGEDFGNTSDTIRAGSQITLPSGDVVGVVLRDFPIEKRDEKGCFRLKIWRGKRGRRAVRLCSRFD